MKLTEKQENCFYCHSSLHTGYSFETKRNYDSFVGIDLKDNGRVEVWTWENSEEYDQLDLEEEFKFCPMCGRSLSNETN